MLRYRLLLAHRQMMWGLVAKIGFDMSYGVANMEFAPVYAMLFNIVYLVITLAVAYCVFQLASSVYGVAPGLICALLVAAPCLGVIVPLMLSGQAQDRLRKAGAPVGMMGATAEQLKRFRPA